MPRVCLFVWIYVSTCGVSWAGPPAEGDQVVSCECCFFLILSISSRNLCAYTYMCVFCVLFFFYICDYIRAYSNVRQMYVHSICVLTAYSQWNLFQNGSQKWGILSCGILRLFLGSFYLLGIMLWTSPPHSIFPYVSIVWESFCHYLHDMSSTTPQDQKSPATMCRALPDWHSQQCPFAWFAGLCWIFN